MIGSSDAVLRIELVESSYVAVAKLALAAVKDGRLPQDDPTVAFLRQYGENFGAWKVKTKALAYKSPWEAYSDCSDQLVIIERAGAQLAAKLKVPNPAIESDVAVGHPDTNWVAIAIASAIAFLAVMVGFAAFKRL